MRNVRFKNAVLICLAAVLIARMPVRRNLAGTLHDNILGQTLIQCKRNLIRRHARHRIENCHVSQRMDAGIRAACAGHCDLLPQRSERWRFSTSSIVIPLGCTCHPYNSCRRTPRSFLHVLPLSPNHFSLQLYCGHGTKILHRMMSARYSHMIR